MNRKESSRLGDLQAEGNLGNERNRNSDSSNRERMRNRSSESASNRDRMSEEHEIGEEWSPSGMHDNNDARRGGEDE
jgi:hypothetical protein